jgi:hypothetical protein
MDCVVPCLLHVLLNVPRKLLTRIIDEIHVLGDFVTKQVCWDKLEKVLEYAKVTLYQGSTDKKGTLTFLERWKKTRTNRNDIIHIMEAIITLDFAKELDELLPHTTTVS